jgi:hypothetical protein
MMRYDGAYYRSHRRLPLSGTTLAWSLSPAKERDPVRHYLLRLRVHCQQVRQLAAALSRSTL